MFQELENKTKKYIKTIYIYINCAFFWSNYSDTSTNIGHKYNHFKSKSKASVGACGMDNLYQKNAPKRHLQ